MRVAACLLLRVCATTCRTQSVEKDPLALVHDDMMLAEQLRVLDSEVEALKERKDEDEMSIQVGKSKCGSPYPQTVERSPHIAPLPTKISPQIYRSWNGLLLPGP